MRPPEGYHLDNLNVCRTADADQRVIEFWLSEGALRTLAQAEHRVPEALFVVRHGNAIAAVSTVYRQMVKQLGHYLFSFRCFVGKAHRSHNLGALLLVSARDYLERRFRDGHDTDTIGLFVVVENERLMTMRNQAVWPISGMVFIGTDTRGNHLRVYYFAGARIS